MPRTFLRFAAALAAFASLAISLSAASLSLQLPLNGAVTNRLTPTLAWTKVEGAERYEIWIDGIRFGEVGAHMTEYVTFPLSFGEHEWKVVAVVGNERITSEPQKFTVDDKPLDVIPKNSLLLRHNWAVQSAWTVNADGAALSSSAVDLKGWSRTSLPATALTALVRNGVYPNPYVGLNMTLIPDANDKFNAENDLLKFSHIPGKNPWAKPYWYRTTFETPSNRGRRAWLVFNEINYRADVWLNGKQLAKSVDMVGMERQFRFDVTEVLKKKGENILAVAIHPLDQPGMPDKAPVKPLADPGENMGTDAMISHNYAKWDVIGWDWQPEVKDRDMGITEDVYVSFTDDIALSDVYVSTDLPLPDTTKADVAISFDAVNHGKTAVSGTIRGTILDGEKVLAYVDQPVTLGPGASRSFEWNAEHQPALRLANPRLWWPAELGDQPLHTVRLEWITADGQRAEYSDEFGVREYTTRLHPVTHSRIFTVNGKDIYSQGGNWVIEMLLNGSASRYEEEIELARRQNLNQLRVWGPTGVPPSVFFRAADRRGVLIWQDFLHDHWGTKQNTPGFEPPLDLFKTATISVIKRLRNHPSLFLWCGGNEGPNPREELITKELLPKYDPRGSRYYLNASLSDGLQGGGPYHTLAPRDYFGRSKLTGFNSEVGPSGVPPWESVRQFLTLPPKEWAPGQFPLDGEWAYHDANDRPGSDERKFTTFDQLVRARFGAPDEKSGVEGVREYVNRSQLVGFEAYRAAVEALNKYRWEKSTGFAIWKYNASWPSLTWQTVDWYLQTNAGYYAFRKAAGPIHVQFNIDDRTLSVINRTTSDEAGFTLHAVVTDVNGNQLWRQDAPFTLRPDGAQFVGKPVPNLPGVTFLSLKLVDRVGRVRADNVYWMNDAEDYTSLAALDGAKLEPIVNREVVGDGQRISVTVRNAGKQPAVMLRLRAIDPDSGVEQLPVYWSDNYNTLLGGETQTFTAELPKNGEAGAKPLVIELSAHNVKPFRVE